MTTRFKFTKTALESLPRPASGRRDTYYDTKVPKLALRVTSTGTRSFYVVKRAGGSMVWFRLGIFPEMSVENAQKAAERALGAFAQDSNPAAMRRAERGEMTLNELFEEYGQRHGMKKRSWRDDQQRYRDYLAKPLGNKKLSAITREAVGKILAEMETAGKAGATINLVRALTSSLYGKGIEWGYASANPVLGIKLRKTIKRDRFIQASELTTFFDALASESNDCLRDFFLLALLTGARRSNVLAMRWENINLSEAVWRIPDTKNGTPQNVTLSPPAVELLTQRRESAAANAAWVFPGTGRSGHLVEPRKGWERLLARSGFENLRIHDLRRTLGSWQAKTGASLVVIGKSLNHKSQQATAIYARLDLDPVRNAVNTATEAMLKAGGITQPIKEEAQHVQ